MEKFEHKDGSGSLFKKDQKKSAKHPDYTGSAKVGGVDFEISAWVRETKNGRPFLSLSIREPLPKEGKTDIPF